MTNRYETIDTIIGKSTYLKMSMLVILRVAVGWHFLYEGVAKLFTPGWTSEGYLAISKWLFAPLFRWIAETPVALGVVDFLNIWGLILIGLGLMFGCFSRAASVSGIVLLLFYYLANPPFIGMDFGVITEGSYLVVDKNIVELLSLCVIALFPTGTFLGIDRYLAYLRARKAETTAQESPETILTPEEPPESFNRRELLKSLATTPVFGVFVITVLRKLGWESYEVNRLEEKRADAVTSATIKTFNFSSLKDLHGQVPHTRIKDMDLSRVILGGNLAGGWAHARDLIYVSKLVKAYHHRDKIFETFLLAEKCGINAFLTNPVLCGVINEYWRRDIGSIKFISDCGGKSLMDGARKSIDNGASACYVHGGMGDKLAREGKMDTIAEAVDFIRQNGLPSGVGAHDLETVKKCVAYGIEPDFWMKTLHSIDYWSARADEAKNGLGSSDNLWCADPDSTVEFMKDLKQPWIAFKTLAAGAIRPESGFKYAFDKGADFICVGMYDFQIVDDVNIALAVLGGDLKRERPWMV
ncbi:DoxX family protein [Candidatus Latescibacterota bacterium]